MYWRVRGWEHQRGVALGGTVGEALEGRVGKKIRSVVVIYNLCFFC